MRPLPLHVELAEKVNASLRQTAAFSGCTPQQLAPLLSRGSLVQFDPDERIYEEGAPADAVYLLLKGEAALYASGSARETSRRGPAQTVGESAVLEGEPRRETAVARGPAAAIRWSAQGFLALLGDVPALSRLVQQELGAASQPASPAVDLGPLSSPHSAPAAAPAASPAGVPPRASPELDEMLVRVVEAGASDLHLSAGHRPRWRLDGAIRRVEGAPQLGPDDVLRLIGPAMSQVARRAFEAENDCDFAYALPGAGRFRVNLFRDRLGVGAVLRHIPEKLLSFAELGLPPVVEQLCHNPKGLVLVTGPTGSGKSTTLAAMIDAINETRRDHIITLEDPIEFVHASKRCLVNQREVGPHTQSFARALRAALREDPDIVLVGEMRDLETVSLALETANTGHLVFGTLHTATAVSTVDRIIGMFPAEQQPQIRATLADSLKGVVAQTLCKRIGGGRIAALEVLVVNAAVTNLIREGKDHQIASAMSTGKGIGNMLLNDELARLVEGRVVDYEEALAKAIDKADLAKKLGKAPPNA
jgi:twitching motility protein PilT